MFMSIWLIFFIFKYKHRQFLTKYLIQNNVWCIGDVHIVFNITICYYIVLNYTHPRTAYVDQIFSVLYRKILLSPNVNVKRYTRGITTAVSGFSPIHAWMYTRLHVGHKLIFFKIPSNRKCITEIHLVFLL